jgi:lipoyl(octanoyl) transferase
MNMVYAAKKSRQAGTDNASVAPADQLLILQHSSVYTLGRRADLSNLKFDPNSNSSAVSEQHKVVRVERGGDVTWHGPGQLVVYPIFDLDNHKRDLHWFMERLEEAVIIAGMWFSKSRF